MKKSLIQLHIAVLLWGFTGVLGKAITLSAPVLVWYRMLLTALLLFFIISYRKQWIKIEKAHLKKMAWVGILWACIGLPSMQPLNSPMLLLRWYVFQLLAFLPHC
jgi:uncharacterized protein with PQ loop repeat